MPGPAPAPAARTPAPAHSSTIRLAGADAPRTQGIQAVASVDRSVVLANGSETVDNPFQELEQDLAQPQSQPPAARVSQTPADPATRPVRNRQPVPGTLPRSVINPDGSPSPDQHPLPGESNQLRGQDSGNRSLRGRNASSSTAPHSSIWQEGSVAPESGAAAVQERIERQGDEPLRQSAEKDCGEFRQQLLSTPISAVALDLSPPRNDRGELPETAYRDWTDIYGNLIVHGRMTGLQRGYVIVETSTGLQKISFARLGETDLAVISGSWQLPTYCLADTGVFAGRCWEPQTVTWHASNLCHKPLYFEDVALERYGHSDGPILQPLRSTAHFFVSLLTLPYQTGIHPPNECLYSLGYYRPGSCAPWIVYPAPLSLKGAAHQAGFMVPAANILF